MPKDQLTEVWCPVPTHPNHYSVSSLGRIRREVRGPNTRPGRIMQTPIDNRGYRVGNFYAPRQRPKGFQVHRIVAEAFLGPAPPGHEVNHKNGNKLDNRVSNLEWTTHRANIRHTIDVLKNEYRRKIVGEKNPNAILTEAIVAEIRHRYATQRIMTARLAADYGVSRTTIRKIIQYLTWK